MIDLFVYRRPDADENIEEVYKALAEKMQFVKPPFGWQGLQLPATPSFHNDDFTAHFEVSYPSNTIRHQGYFQYRDVRYLDEDRAAKDDAMSFHIVPLNDVDYTSVLRLSFPELVIAFGAYRAIAYFDDYVLRYYQVHSQELKQLRAKPDVNVNGRNNIFTLHPAQFWDAELCQRALGYGRDEVIKRLTGKVPLVKPLMDGVYVVFNDNPNLTFEEFCAVNDRFKPMLGLV